VHTKRSVPRATTHFPSHFTVYLWCHIQTTQPADAAAAPGPVDDDAVLDPPPMPAADEDPVGAPAPVPLSVFPGGDVAAFRAWVASLTPAHYAACLALLLQ